jgi:PAS domain S-box-containing protein
MASFVGDAPAATSAMAMEDRRELALVAVERTRMPMVVTDPRQPDNPIILANRAFLELTGYEADEVLGQNCRFLQGPQTSPDVVTVIRQGLAAGKDHVAVELLNYRKDGSAFWNQLSISPVVNERGALIYHFGSQKDVTARRRVEQMEATERLLMMEIDHRSINALTLVQSIVRLSSAGTVSDFSSMVEGWVGALARAHRLLAKSSWAGVDVGQLLAGETPLRAKARVRMTGPPVRLPAPVVQPLALVLHELMTNAGKHGALAGDAGHVTVKWQEQPRQFSLDWREMGLIGMASPSEPRFGLRMLTNVVELQLGGKVATWWGGPGFRAEITLPVRTSSATP